MAKLVVAAFPLGRCLCELSCPLYWISLGENYVLAPQGGAILRDDEGSTTIVGSCWQSGGHVTAEIDIANMTALQKHVSFFDRNKDGVITPSETIEGVVAIGCDFAFARDLAASVHAGLGPKTSPKDAPLPHLSIYINNIYRGMHRSDTGALDAKGRAAAIKEWGLIYGLASDNNGYFHKDSVRGIYDGSVFVKLEKERESSQSTVCRSSV
uniref:EF-hand domain-containing protein n=1 Tax=Oryza glumipatula TaxID=40148 RepID=A0A0E0A7R6_9ORYZ